MNQTTGFAGRISNRKGIYFALVAALISGVSVYINKFAVEEMDDPFVFTTTKNIAVALLLFALILFPRALPEIKALRRDQWLKLGLIGCIGGSVPFLMFFYGLDQGTAAGAGFIHKTLFFWVALLSFFLLRERFGLLHWAGLGALIMGNWLILGWPSKWMGDGELLILGATMFWAVEAIIAKKVMAQMSAEVAAFGRMFFGSIVMLGYLSVAGKTTIMTSLNGEQFGWIVMTGVLLMGYVSFYYAGLKHAPASVVACLLVPGSVVTSLLYTVFDAKRYSSDEVLGMGLLVVAALVFCLLGARSERKGEIVPVMAEG